MVAMMETHLWEFFNGQSLSKRRFCSACVLPSLFSHPGNFVLDARVGRQLTWPRVELGASQDYSLWGLERTGRKDEVQFGQI